jgi:HEAT repeat protein
MDILVILRDARITIAQRGMNNTVQSCYIILNKKTGWFFRRRRTVEKLECLKIIQQLGTPSDIHWLIRLFKNKNEQIRAKTGDTIGYLFSKLSFTGHDQQALRHASITVHEVADYEQLLQPHHYLVFVEMASLNHNGYVREKAMKALADLRQASSFRFILLRVGDWVDEVRLAAIKAMENFLEQKYVPELLKHLTLINALLRIQRTDLREQYQQLVDFIFSPDNADSIEKAVRHLDDKTRWHYYRYRLSNEQLDIRQINTIVRDKNFLIRLDMLRHLRNYPMAVQQQIGTCLLTDKSPSLRLEAMQQLLPERPDREEWLHRFIADDAAAVRDRSRRILRYSDIHFAQLYRERMATGDRMPGSLLGLFETGSEMDKPLFIDYLSNEKAVLVIGALRAMNRLDRDQAKSHALRLLRHPIKKIRSVAIEILAKQVDEETMKEIRQIYATGNADIKRSVLSLYHKMGDWKIIGDVLLAAGDEEVTVQEMAWDMLAKWRIKVVRLFTRPTVQERERAAYGYNILQQNKQAYTLVRKQLLTDLAFFLR